MLTSEHLTHANDDWEERMERDKKWLQWKTAYKQAHAKARVKAQANYGSVKFGAANSAACQETATPPLDYQLEGGGGDLKTLEGYFHNLAAAAVNKKGVLQQLVLNKTTLYTSNNESLSALVKNLSNDIKNLERRIYRLKKGGQVSARNTTLCANCKKEGFHQPQDSYELPKNKDKRPPGWRSDL